MTCLLIMRNMIKCECDARRPRRGMLFFFKKKTRVVRSVERELSKSVNCVVKRVYLSC